MMAEDRVLPQEAQDRKRGSFSFVFVGLLGIYIKGNVCIIGMFSWLLIFLVFLLFFFVCVRGNGCNTLHLPRSIIIELYVQ